MTLHKTTEDKVLCKWGSKRNWESSLDRFEPSQSVRKLWSSPNKRDIPSSFDVTVWWCLLLLLSSSRGLARLPYLKCECNVSIPRVECLCSLCSNALASLVSSRSHPGNRWRFTWNFLSLSLSLSLPMSFSISCLQVWVLLLELHTFAYENDAKEVATPAFDCHSDVPLTSTHILIRSPLSLMLRIPILFLFNVVILKKASHISSVEKKPKEAEARFAFFLHKLWGDTKW